MRPSQNIVWLVGHESERFQDVIFFHPVALRRNREWLVFLNLLATVAELLLALLPKLADRHSLACSILSTMHSLRSMAMLGGATIEVRTSSPGIIAVFMVLSLSKVCSL